MSVCVCVCVCEPGDHKPEPEPGDHKPEPKPEPLPESEPGDHKPEPEPEPLPEPNLAITNLHLILVTVNRHYPNSLGGSSPPPTTPLKGIASRKSAREDCGRCLVVGGG